MLDMDQGVYFVELSCGHMARVFGPQPIINEGIICSLHQSWPARNIQYPVVVCRYPEGAEVPAGKRWSVALARGLWNYGRRPLCPRCWVRAVTTATVCWRCSYAVKLRVTRRRVLELPRTREQLRVARLHLGELPGLLFDYLCAVATDQ